MLSSSFSPLTSNTKLHLPSPSQLISALPFNTCLSHSQRMRMALSNCFSETTANPILISPSDQSQPREPDSHSLVAVSFYKFTEIPDHADLRKSLELLCQDLGSMAVFVAHGNQWKESLNLSKLMTA